MESLEGSRGADSNFIVLRSALSIGQQKRGLDHARIIHLHPVALMIRPARRTGRVGGQIEGIGGFLELFGMLRYQDDFANVLPGLDVAMRFGDLVEWKSAINVRADPSFLNTAHAFAGPGGNFFAFLPHVSAVKAEHTTISIHHTQAMKPR